MNNTIKLLKEIVKKVKVKIKRYMTRKITIKMININSRILVKKVKIKVKIEY